MQLDRNGLEVLSRAECLGLLAHSLVGRVIVTDRALPAAFPVNFALLDEDVVFLTAPGSKLEAASVEAVVAFEADEIDPAHHAGWSVLVQGRAALVDDPAEIARVGALGLEPWAPLTRTHPVRVRSELVSGRRLGPAAVERVGGVRPPAIAGCATCGSQELLPVTDGTVTNFVCTACASCWHLTAGVLRRVDPAQCAGCPFKPMCTAAAARDQVLAADRRLRP